MKLQFFNFLFIDYREREKRGRERKRERNIDLLFHLFIQWLLLVWAMTGDWTHNLGLSGNTLTNWAMQPGLELQFLKITGNTLTFFMTPNTATGVNLAREETFYPPLAFPWAVRSGMPAAHTPHTQNPQMQAGWRVWFSQAPVSP